MGDVLAALILAAAIASADCMGPFSADEHHIGPIELSQSVATLRASSLDIKRTVVTDDCCEHAHYLVKVCPGMQIDVDADEYDKILVAISTSSPGFATREGAHVGMTVRRLKAMYPNGRVTYGNGEGRYAAFVIVDGLYFSIDYAGIPDACFETSKTCDTLFEDKLSVGLQVR